MCVHDEELADDPWLPIRSAVDSFNRNRRESISPGVTLCADESMGSWRGLSAEVDNAVVGLPHVTKIARKPEGVGTEHRTLSCGETKIMLQMEIQKGKVPMQEKEYAKDYGSGTSSVIRLTRYWSRPYSCCRLGICFVEDSRSTPQTSWSSFHWPSKDKQFPKAWLPKYPYTNRGDHCVLLTNIDGKQYMAVGWSDKKLKMFVSSTSNILPCVQEALSSIHTRRQNKCTMCCFL